MSHPTISTPFDNHALRRIADVLGLSYLDVGNGCSVNDFDDATLEIVLRRVIRDMRATLRARLVPPMIGADEDELVVRARCEEHEQQARMKAAIDFVRREL